jgi:hypothetical protein
MQSMNLSCTSTCATPLYSQSIFGPVYKMLNKVVSLSINKVLHLENVVIFGVIPPLSSKNQLYSLPES